jgi:predicted PurR-regulated permease PerM
MQSSRTQNTFFVLIVAVTTILFFWIIRDFLQPVFWAILLAILFQPLYKRLLKLLSERRSLAGLLSVLAIVLLVLIPLILIGLAVFKESLSLYQQIASGKIDVLEPIRYLEKSLPVVTEHLEHFGLNLDKIKQWLSSTAVNTSQFIATNLFSLGQDAVRFAALTLIMLYLLYFFLKDGQKIMDLVIKVIPMGDERERSLFRRFAEVSRATMKGTFVVGLVQGSIGGLLFWILGIEAAIFWGVIMTLLSFLPVFGSSLIWVPAAGILLATGYIFKGLFLLAAGSIIIGLSDNILRPILVGRETKLPDYLVLISTLGGITVFGISGLIIGPVIAALFLTVWEMFGQEFAVEHKNDLPLPETDGQAPKSSD